MELRAARRSSRLPLAASDDATRLAVLVSATDEHRAVGKVWRRLGQALLVDVVCSLFPDADGMYRMSIPLTSTTARRLDVLAAAAGQSPEEYLHALSEALAHDRSARQARLECRLGELLRDFDPEEVTAAAARRWRGKKP